MLENSQAAIEPDLPHEVKAEDWFAFSHFTWLEREVKFALEPLPILNVGEVEAMHKLHHTVPFG